MKNILAVLMLLLSVSSHAQPSAEEMARQATRDEIQRIFTEEMSRIAAVRKDRSLNEAAKQAAIRKIRKEHLSKRNEVRLRSHLERRARRLKQREAK